jgi:hypothetical protein
VRESNDQEIDFFVRIREGGGAVCGHEVPDTDHGPTGTGQGQGQLATRHKRALCYYTTSTEATSVQLACTVALKASPN